MRGRWGNAGRWALLYQPACHVGWIRGGGVLGGGSENERIPFAQDCLVWWWLAPRRSRGVIRTHIPPFPAEVRAPLQ